MGIAVTATAGTATGDRGKAAPWTLSAPESLASRFAPLLAAAIALAIGGAIAWRRTPSADVLWFLDVAHRVAGGQVLYRDVLEINPPLVVWLLLPFARAAHSLEWFTAAVVVLMTASAAVTARIVGRTWAFPALLVVLLVVPVGWFGQREHLAIALMLPWLARTLASGEAAWPEGIAAGIGFALKPQLLLALLVVAPRGRLATRGNLALAATLAAYAALVAIVTPDYLRMLSAIGGDYVAYGRADARALLWWNASAWIALIGPVAWLAARAGGFERRLGDGLAVATLGYLAGALVQGKGWNYHYAPAITTSALVLFLAAAQPLRPFVLGVRCLAVALSAGFAGYGLGGLRLPAQTSLPGVTRESYGRLVAGLGDAGHPRSVLALYRHEGHAFSLSAFGGARFVSPFPMLWLLETPGWQARLPWWTDRIARAARRDPPDLILISRDTAGGVSCIEALSRDPAIASLLSAYEPRPDVDGYGVFVPRTKTN